MISIKIADGSPHVMFKDGECALILESYLPVEATRIEILKDVLEFCQHENEKWLPASLLSLKRTAKSIECKGFALTESGVYYQTGIEYPLDTTDITEPELASRATQQVIVTVNNNTWNIFNRLRDEITKLIATE